jgi:hypothetical protein
MDAVDSALDRLNKHWNFEWSHRNLQLHAATCTHKEW